MFEPESLPCAGSNTCFGVVKATFEADQVPGDFFYQQYTGLMWSVPASSHGLGCGNSVVWLSHTQTNSLDQDKRLGCLCRSVLLGK